MEVYILDGNLKKIGLIQGFKSFIWAERYRDVGDCELYIPASVEALDLVRVGNYIFRSDIEHLCIIKKITVTTSAENGNYLIVQGQDAKSFLEQRIIWGTTTINGNVAAALRKMVRVAAADQATAQRMLVKANGDRLLYTIGNTDLTETAHEQISYSNLGEVIRDRCRLYGWGYRVQYTRDSDGSIDFQLYKGADKSGQIIFSKALENLNSSKYIVDDLSLGNVALVAGEGEGSKRARTTVGAGSSTERYEVFVDAKDLSKNIPYEELTAAYTGGTISQSGGKYYYSVSGTVIAEVPSASPAASDTAVLTDAIYETYLTAKGEDALAEYGEKTSFEGAIVPRSQFELRKDYDLGDIVSIRTEYGVSATARVIETVEVWDENGYSLEPRFEYIEVSNSLNNLLTENRENLLTENGTRLLTRSTSDADGVAISELPDTSSLAGEDVFPVVQNGTTKKVQYSIVKALSDKTSSIPFSKVDSTSTATVFTATVAGITELRDGVCCMLMNGVVTSTTNFTLNVNGLGAKPVYSNLAAATRDTTIFNINYTMLFIYDEDRVSGGCWICYRGYDSNTNTIGYQIRTNSSSLPTTQKFYRYRLLFTSPDGTHFVPANTSTSTNATAARAVNQEAIDPFGKIVYYGTTTAINAGARPAATVLWQQYAITLGYSFNRTGAALNLEEWKPVYLKCTPQADGSVIIDADTPYVQSLPTAADGKVYIFLGIAYSDTAMELTLEHPVYYYENGIRLWSNDRMLTGFDSTGYESATGTSGSVAVKTWTIAEAGLYQTIGTGYMTRTGYTAANQALMKCALTVTQYRGGTAVASYSQQAQATGGGDCAVSAMLECEAGDTIVYTMQQFAGSSGVTLAQQTFYVRSSILKLK